MVTLSATASGKPASKVLDFGGFGGILPWEGLSGNCTLGSGTPPQPSGACPGGVKCQATRAEVIYTVVMAIGVKSGRTTPLRTRSTSEPHKAKSSPKTPTKTKAEVKAEPPTRSTATVQSAAQAREKSANNSSVRQRRRQAEQKLDPGQGVASNRSNSSRRNFNVGTADIDAQSGALSQSMNSQGRTIINGTNADDQIQVSLREGGGLLVQNGAQRIELSEAQAQNLEIRAGAGDDSITVDSDVPYDLTLRGGEGNDTITGGAGNDRIYGDQGRDTLKGEAGNDYIEGGDGNDRINGGEGRDVLYGLDGNDRINGGAGRDYLDGGDGNDRLAGGDGIDQVIGGRGNDNLRGGRGDDVLAGGEGRDAYNGDQGADSIFYQENDNAPLNRWDNHTLVEMGSWERQLGKSINISGTPAFENRVLSDLNALRSLPSGQSMLRDLDRAGRTTTIQDSPVDASYFQADASINRFQTNRNTANGRGTGGTINYSPSSTDSGENNAWAHGPPIVGLNHEIGHAENAAQGSMPLGNTDGEANRERIAVGLSIDDDGDPNTPRIQPNRNNENRLRAELNLERRERYGE